MSEIILNVLYRTFLIFHIFRTVYGEIPTKIEPKLWTLLKLKQTSIIVTLNGHEDALKYLTEKAKNADRETRLKIIGEGLQTHFKKVESEIIRILDDTLQKRAPSVSYNSYWVSSQISVRGADLELVQTLAGLPQTKFIQKQLGSWLPKPMMLTNPEYYTNGSKEPQSQTSAKEPTWGLRQIRAPQAWDMGVNGTGIVVGSIDFGVRWTHSALKENYRKDFGWFDPFNASVHEPVDTFGHGTHTVGTMVGRNIGVAPGSEWIACRGCKGLYCPTEMILKCGQWMQCPYNDEGFQDCSKAPHIINNSWGGGKRGDRTYANMIKTWRAANIIPVFAVGNLGVFPKTVGSPADLESGLIISVGASNYWNRLAVFSSRGPSVYNEVKPEVVAPGDFIYSAWNFSDDSYLTLSGTSFSAPHVAGIIALMLQKHPDSTFEEIQRKLFSSCLRANSSNSNSNPNLFRRGRHAGYDSYPNNYVGYGIVDAVNSIS